MLSTRSRSRKNKNPNPLVHLRTQVEKGTIGSRKKRMIRTCPHDHPVSKEETYSCMRHIWVTLLLCLLDEDRECCSVAFVQQHSISVNCLLLLLYLFWFGWLVFLGGRT